MQLTSKPMNSVDITKLSTEGLAMLFIFLPNYFHEPEGGIVSAARNELLRRGVIEVKDSSVMWNLDEDTREELAEVFVVDRMLHTFKYVTRAPRKRK